MPSRISKKSKKKKKNGKPGENWKDNEIIEILAWADLNLEIDASWETFNETVETHLREACGVQKSLAQVNGKLDRIWKKWGREGVYDFPNLIKQEGSRCLESPDFQWHEAIARRKKALEHDHFIAQLSTRTTRSASKTGGNGLSRSRSILNGDFVGSPSPWRKARVKSVRQSPCPQARNQTRTVDEDCIQDFSAVAPIALGARERKHTPLDKAQRQDTIRNSFSDDTLELDSASEPEDEFSTPPFPKQEPVAFSPTSAENVEAASSISTRQICWAGMVNATIRTGPHSVEQPTEYASGQHSHTEEGKLQARIAFLSSQLKATEDKADAYKQQLDSLKSAQQASSKGLDLEQLLADSRSRVKTLQNTLADRKLLHTFSSLDSTQSVPCDKGYIGAAMTQMGGEINGLARLDHTQICDLSTIMETSDLSLLILRAFPDVDPSQGHISLRDRVPQALKLKEVLRTLVAAAVCCWVFDSPLDFLHSGSPCPLLSQYRRCLEMQDGRKALRNLDFAAHKILLEEDLYHKQFVPTEARYLTTRVCEVFRPLFVQQELMGLVPQSSLYKPTDKGPDDVSSLQRIFESALKVKARLVLSTNAFEAVMYAPGTPISRTRMKPRNRLGILVDVPPRQKPEILCCYLPALVEHEKSNTLVDHNNFIQSAQAERYRLKPFSQAVVLV